MFYSNMSGPRGYHQASLAQVSPSGFQPPQPCLAMGPPTGPHMGPALSHPCPQGHALLGPTCPFSAWWVAPANPGHSVTLWSRVASVLLALWRPRPARPLLNSRAGELQGAAEPRNGVRFLLVSLWNRVGSDWDFRCVSRSLPADGGRTLRKPLCFSTRTEARWVKQSSANF